jgi:prepilin peptidase CpaA
MPCAPTGLPPVGALIFESQIDSSLARVTRPSLYRRRKCRTVTRPQQLVFSLHDSEALKPLRWTMAANFLFFFTLVLFPALMAFSASSDLFTMTIPNRVSVALVVGYLVLAAAVGLPLITVAIDLSCGVAVLVLTFFLFSQGWIGGGDAKLAAATALWLGWAHILDYSLIASVLGGALTIGLIVSRKTQLPAWAARLDWVARLHHPETGVPYGIALAVAGLVLYPQTQIWRAAAGV